MVNILLAIETLHTHMHIPTYINMRRHAMLRATYLNSYISPLSNVTYM